MSETHPLTFAVPFHRGRRYLRAAIESVLAQTRPDWRLLVVDDAGPEPGIDNLVASFADPRLSYVRNPVNLGLAGNWNRCVALADTPLVTVLHADDELLPGYAAAVIGAHERHPGTAAVFTRAAVVGDDGSPRFSFPDAVKRLIEPRSRSEWVIEGDAGLARVLRGQFIFCPSLCYATSRIGAAPFSGRWRMVLDLDLLARLLLAEERVVGVPEVHYAYRRHAESETARLTSSNVRFAEELAIYDEIAAAARAKGWARAARVARAKTVIRLHLAYRALGDLVRGRLGSARARAASLAWRQRLRANALRDSGAPAGGSERSS